MKKLSVGKWMSVITCALAVVTFIMLLIYGSQGGIVHPAAYAALAVAALLEAAALLGEKSWTDFAGIIAAAALAFVLMRVFSDGIWNIAEAMNGIKMVGIPELAGMNYQLAGVNLAAVVTAITANFMKK